MKILISGGTGFIGQHFINRFSEHRYTIITRDIVRAKSLLGDSHHYITSIGQLQGDEIFDAVINLAGEPIVGRRWTGERKQALLKSRWHITQDLVTWINSADVKPRCFLSGSAIGVYGIHDNHAFCESDKALHVDFSSELCQRWESIALSAQLHTRTVLLRTGVVLSPDGGALAKMLLPFKLGLGGPIGHGKQWMSWIHLEDYLNGLHFLLENKQSQGAYNLTAPQPVTNKTFVAALGEALGRPTFIPMPSIAMKLALGEAATLLLDGQKVLPKKIQNEGFTFAFEDIKSAMFDLVGA